MNITIYDLALVSLGLAIGLIVGILGVQWTIINKKSQLSSKMRRYSERTTPQERKRLREVYTLISTITATLKYQRVLELALDMCASILGSPGAPADHLVNAALLFTKAEGKAPTLQIGAACRLTPTDMRLVFKGTSGLIGNTIELGEPQLSTNLPDDPELSRLVTLRACNVAYCVPLRANLDTYGVLLFAHPDPNFFNQANSELLEIISHQAVIAIQNARLYSDLEQEKERMIEIQEETREKLARDLHDGPAQSLANIATRLTIAQRMLERDPKEAFEEIGKIEELARRTIKEIRHMLFTLRPLILESQGLIPALIAMAEKIKETYGQDVIIEAEPEPCSQIEMGKRTIIFFIVEEAVNNARKHAHAAHIWVRVKSLEKDLMLVEVQDDGTGFDIENMKGSYDQRDSLGMINMRERTELVNGVFQIKSEAGKGTIIRVLIPLSEESVDRLRRGG